MLGKATPAAGPATTVFLVLAAAVAPAQESVDERANAAYQAGDWPQSLELYGEVVAEAPGNATAHYRLAVAARQVGDAALASEALDRAQALGVPAQFVEIERARLHAAADDGEATMAALERALAAGFANPDALTGDEFADFIEDPAFEALIERAQANRAPCDSREPFHHFDFWLGDWRVHDARDNFAGTNRITRAEGGCYLLEEWTGASGSTGSSMNFYDAARGEWVQQWISRGGTQIHIRGGLENGSMRLVGKIYYINQSLEADFRGTWTPLEDGRVRQFFEQSVDAGETWSPWFEGFYTRVEPPVGDAE